jgi:pimeloyl-ACP methyl ester carboxylesterase
VHYEVFGKGQPVILLHGYQGSWGLWERTMTALAEDCRMYALDFWGFGESGPRRGSFAIDDFEMLVGQFMDELGIGHAPLVGHSMGGTVGLLFALRQPHRVEKAIVIGAPIHGSSLFFIPRVFGYRAVAWITYHNLWLYRLLYHLLAPRYSRDPRWSELMDRDVSRTTLGAFFASVGSLRLADLRGLLGDMRCPVYGMYGARDNVVDPREAGLLKESCPEAAIRIFPESGHFIMLDEPEAFVRTLQEFLRRPAPAFGEAT